MRHLLPACAMVLALSACLPGSETPQASADPLPPESSFAVLEIDGQPAPPGTSFELSANDEISGQAPCNRYRAQLTRGNAGISIGMGISTRMACLDDSLTRAETQMLAALPEITGASAGPGAGQVALTDASGATRLLLEPQADSAAP